MCVGGGVEGANDLSGSSAACVLHLLYTYCAHLHGSIDNWNMYVCVEKCCSGDIKGTIRDPSEIV